MPEETWNIYLRYRGRIIAAHVGDYYFFGFKVVAGKHLHISDRDKYKVWHLVKKRRRARELKKGPSV